MLQLAELGADIIKIENPLTRGDVARTVPPYLEEGVNDSIYFQAFNRNTRSLTLNLQLPQGTEVLHRLIKVSHGVYSNLRGDLPTRMKLRYRDLEPVNPAIVTCHLTGYGLDNSQSRRPSYDMLVQAETGMMEITGEPGAPPARSGIPIVDFAGGYNSAFALVSGILKAQMTGKGCDLDVSLFDTAVSMLSYMASWHLTRGAEIRREPDSSHPSQVPSGVFPTKDGWIVIMCAKEEFFQSLCDILGHGEWKDDRRFRRFADRLGNRSILVPLLKEEFKRKTAKEWLDLMGNAVPSAPVHDIAHALTDPFLQERDLVLEMEHPAFGSIRAIRSSVKSDAAPSEPRPAPTVGQNTDEILTELGGYSPDEVKALRTAGVL